MSNSTNTAQNKNSKYTCTWLKDPVNFFNESNNIVATINEKASCNTAPTGVIFVDLKKKEKLFENNYLKG